MKEVREIIKRLELISSRGFEISKVFSDWIDIMLYAFLSQSLYSSKEDAAEHEANYLKTINRYKNNLPGQRAADLFTEALTLLMLQMKETNRELLGEIYELLALSYKGFGQFFTPVNLCRLIAQIVYSGPSRKDEKINDCCCGSGRLLIEAHKLHPDAQLIAQDIDLRCVKITALNFLFFNINGLVIWGNSLALEEKLAYRTIRSICGGSIYQVKEDLQDG